MMPPLLTVEEAALTLGVHMQTVYRWLRAGTLKGYRLGESGRQWRVDADELAAFARSRPNS